jgi:RNA ligase
MPLGILNYTARAQYEWLWDDVTRRCRGLIVHDDGTVVARGLDKFFSLDQLRSAELTLPDEPFEVHEKVDGSLIIVFIHDGSWHVASRGSFVSDQARWASVILGREFENGLELDPSSTYYFELVHPMNRIVVDYGNDEKLVLLAEFDTETGAEREVHEQIYPTVPIARRYAFDSVDDLCWALETDGRFAGQEGFVLRYRSGLRVKVKSAEYLHYHRLVSRCTPKRIWEHLSEGGSVDKLTNGLWSAPADWIKMHAGRLQDRFLEIRARSLAYYQDALDASTAGDRIERKDFALWVRRHVPEYGPMLFAYFDDKDQEVIDRMIWRQLKPRGDEVFRPESEDV